jgi:uncharacterized protein YndB with AHSA1/START domain
MFERRYSHSIEISAAPQTVWRVMCDLSRLPEWYFPSQRVELIDTGPVHPGTRFVLWIRTAAGVVVRAPGEIMRVEPLRLLQWRGQSNGIAATATWTLEAFNGSTRLSHEFAGGGWMMFLSAITGRAPKTARKRLEGLKKVVEGQSCAMQTPSI